MSMVMDDELRFRLRMVPVGMWVTCALVLGSLPWIALTWGRPGRAAMLGLIVLGGLSGLLIAVLPTERIVAGRWREPFFLAWSAADVAFIATIATLDAGAASPVSFAMFLTLIFAALSYPLASVAAVCGMNLVAFILVFCVRDDVGPVTPGLSHLWMFVLTLACAGAMCGWQTRLQGRLRHELTRLSRADPLTGALNRRGFAERVDAEIARGGVASLVLLDLDAFKEINDSQGHAAGDELLTWVVSALHGLVRPEDAVGRLGGDEFAVLLPGTDAEAAAEIAARVRAALGERVQACAGAASIPDDGSDAESLYREADAALYDAKRERALSA
jgi:diguanylate cyclase (GGDEF)-like protein